MKTNSFRDLIVWQKAKNLAVSVFELTGKFPSSELYGLINQMRRAAISISSNIAESYNRVHKREKNQFLRIAYGSGSELESQMEIAKVLFKNLNYTQSEELLLDVMKILNSFLSQGYSRF